MTMAKQLLKALGLSVFGLVVCLIWGLVSYYISGILAFAVVLGIVGMYICLVVI